MKIRMRKWAGLLPVMLLAGAAAPAAGPDTDPATVDRGRYLVAVSGCNDCHTPGYGEAAGATPPSAWLTGNAVGFQGPWGTSYPSNLRLLVRTMSEDQWLVRARQPMRPPMPWFGLRDMTDPDLRSVYRFIYSLGPAGQPAPAASAPGQPVATPYFEFVPKNLPVQARR